MVKLIDKQVPQIRFKEFESKWVEEPILSRITKVIDFRGRTPKKLGLDWSDAGYLALSALNVKDGYIDRSVEAHFGSEELYSTWMKGNELHCNQVLFTTEAPMGNVAQIPDTQKYILSQRAIAFVTDPFRLSEDYLAILLKSSSVYKQLLARSSGGTAKGVSQKSLSSIKVSLSDELNEQAKIGKYFKRLNKVIGLNKRKHDKLITLKQAMLKKMFPQDGATTPEIRFKGYSGSWEGQALKFLADRYDNLRVPISATKRISGDTPYYGANGIQGYVQGYTHDGEFILIAEDGASDINNYPVQYVRGKIWVNNHAHVLQGKKNVADNLFLKYAFSQLNVKPFLVGGGRLKLNAEIMMIMELITPTDVIEQQKIGIYFYKLDSLISQYGIQLEKLKQIKLACLEKMLI